MNILRDQKVIWWAPERSATKVTAAILKDLGFEFDRTDEMVVDQENELLFSHSEKDLPDCKIICSMRNPYDRIFSIFMNYDILKMVAPTKEIKPKLIEYFHKWVKTYFEKNKLIVKINDYGKVNVTSEALKKFTFRNKIPDQFIRMENLIYDLGSITFVNKSIDWQTGKTQEFLKSNKYQKTPCYDFKEFYDIETAKLIYEYYFVHFHMVGYDPFSFTNSDIDEKTKLHFIHDTF